MAIEINANTTQAQQQISQLERAMATLERRLDTVTRAGSELEKENASLAAAQRKVDEALKASSISLSKLATNSEAALSSLGKVEARINSTYAAATALAAATDGDAVALKQLSTSLTATEIATNKLNSAYSKLASLEANQILLRNTGYQQLQKEIAAKEAAAAATMNQAKAEAALATAKATAQASYKAQALQGVTAARNIVGISSAPDNNSALLANQMRERYKLQEMYNKEVGRGVMAVRSFTEADLASANTMSLKNATLNKSHTLLTQTADSQEKMAGAGRRLTEQEMQLHSALRGTSGALGKLWLTYGDILPMMAGFLAASTAIASVKLSANFENTLKLVEVFGSSFGEASESADELGKKLLAMEGLRKGPDELALGLKEFIKAGATAEKSLADLEEMTRFATLAEIDMAQAVKLVVAQSNAFANTSYADAANKISVAAVASTTDIKELGTAMAYTTPLGSVLGFSFSEVATALALLANKGIESSKAGTSLTTTFTRLAAPASKAQKMLNELGVSFSAFDENGHIKPMLRQLEELSVIFQKLGDEDRIKLMGALSDLRSLKGLGNLIQDIGDKSEVWNDMYNKVNKASEGVTFLTQAAERLDDTTIAKWEKLVVVFKQLGTSSAVNSISKGTLDMATDFTSAIEMLLNPIDTYQKYIGQPFVEATEKAGAALEGFVGTANSEETKKAGPALQSLADKALIAKVKLETSRVEPAPKQSSIFEIMGIPNPLQAQAQFSAWSVFMKSVKEGAGELSQSDLIMSASKGSTVPKDSFEQLTMINKEQESSVRAIIKAREDQAKAEESAMKKAIAATQRRIEKERELQEQEREAYEGRVKATNMHIAALNGIQNASTSVEDSWTRLITLNREYEATIVGVDKELGTFFNDLDSGMVTTTSDLESAVTGWASHFSAELTDMVFSADLSFGKIIESFSKMILQMIIQKQLVEPFLNFAFSKPSAGATFSGSGSVPASLSAKGNIFQGPGISAYSNSIVDQPTRFFARGGNIMGEAGPEAIMPVKPMPSGNLGVEVSGARPITNINIINNTDAKVTQNEKENDSGGMDIEIMFDMLTAKNLSRRGGPTNRAARAAVGSQLINR